MKRTSITFKLLSVIVAGFILTTVSALFLANYQLKKMIDKSQSVIYSEKLDGILGTLDRSFQRLKATERVEAYEEDFKESVLRSLRYAHYKIDGQRISPFIVTGTGRIVMHPELPRGDTSLANVGCTPIYLQLKNGDCNSTNVPGQRNWCIFKYFKDWDWIVAYTVPLEVKYAEARFFRNSLIIISTVTASLVVLGLIIVITKMTRPIVKLTTASEAMASGDLDYPIDISGSDELAILAHGFINMRDAIRQKISALAETNQALRESEERFNLAVEGARDGIWDHTVGDEDKDWWSPRLYELLGYEDGEIKGFHSTFTELLHPDDSDKTTQAIRDYLEKRPPGGIDIEYRMMTKSGKYLWFQSKGAAIWDEKGNAIRMSGSLRDITERKQAEAEREKVIHSRNERAKELRCIYDVTKSIQARTILEEIFQDVAELIPPGWQYPEITRGKVIFDGKEYVSEPFEETGWKQSSDVIVNGELRGSIEVYYLEECPGMDEGPFMTEERSLINGIARNISKAIERKQAEAEREQLFKTVTAKNKELQSIVYVASHDLRSPLVNIEGFGGELANSCQQLEELMRDAVFDETKAKEASTLINEYIPESLKFIKAGTAKMSSLLTGLLQVSRVGSKEVDIKPLDMNKIMNNVRHSMEFQIKDAGAELFIQDMPNCLGDDDMINQVFSNLIGNALKYLDPDRKGKIHISGRIEDGNGIYCVTDNGIGINPAHQGKIFELFHRLNPADTTGGEGLGLTIVTRILDRLNGSIRVESEPGNGSKFFVSLPTAKP